MCGINCIINFNNHKVLKKDVLSMNQKIYHRGPDNQQVFIQNNVGFGHCRLSIIDLNKRANQPMHSYDERYLIIYNGEVYNFKKLKKKLIDKGIKFNTNCDTEVVLNSYAYWGEECVNFFDGMFAFLIWDKKKKELFGARDKFGIKPLYFYYDETKIILSSEIKAIEPLLTNKELNYDSIVEYFLFQNYLNNKTLLKKINLIEKGTYFFLKNKKIRFFKYFSHKKNFKNKDKNSNKLFNVLQKSIKDKLISDVKVGSYLSSGLDSSLVSYFASRELKNLNTFTCGFDIKDQKVAKFNELFDAQEISSQLKTQHHSVVFKKESFEDLYHENSYIIEEPRLGVSLPNLLVAKLVKGYNKVVLSGAGADELFGGYPWRYKPAFDSKNLNEFKTNYFKQNFRIDPFTIDKLFKPILNKTSTEDIIKNFHSFFNFLDIDSDKNDFFNGSLLFDLEYFLEGYCILEDKISMSQSIETRLPYLGDEIYSLSSSLSSKYMINFDKSTNEFEGKLCLRELARNKLPDKFIKKKKLVLPVHIIIG